LAVPRLGRLSAVLVLGVGLLAGVWVLHGKTWRAREAADLGLRWIGAEPGLALEGEAELVFQAVASKLTHLVSEVEAATGVSLDSVRAQVLVRAPLQPGLGAAAAVRSNWMGSCPRHELVLFPAALSAGTPAALRTLRHELVHLSQRHVLGRREEDLPRWLREGLAVSIAGEGPALLSRTCAEVGLGRDPRREPKLPEVPLTHDGLRGYLFLQVVVGDAPPGEAEALRRALVVEPQPLEFVARKLDCPLDHIEKELARSAGRLWREAFLPGWAEKSWVLDAVQGSPLGDAEAVYERFASAYPSSPHRFEPAVFLAERLCRQGRHEAAELLARRLGAGGDEIPAALGRRLERALFSPRE
jgi:hypothetical protein